MASDSVSSCLPQYDYAVTGAEGNSGVEPFLNILILYLLI